MTASDVADAFDRIDGGAEVHMPFLPRAAVPDHPLVLGDPHAMGIVTVEGRDEPRAVRLLACPDHTCPCSVVSLSLHDGESSDDSEAPPWVKVDTELDEVTYSPALVPEDRAALEEAVAALPAGEEGFALAHALLDQAVDAHLATARIPVEEIVRGQLQSWIRLARGAYSTWDGGVEVDGQLAVGGTDWIVDLRYCPRASCDCREMNVIGFRVLRTGAGGGEGDLERAFHATCAFDGRIAHLDVEGGTSRALARAVVEAWFDQLPDSSARFRQQYEDVRAVARRSMAQARADQVAARQTKVGRNEACPCGSGKKYKRCCGA